MLAELAPYLVLVGLTILAAVAWLWRQSRRVNAASLALIRLNEELEHDALRLLQAAWPQLRRAGIRGYAWQADWYGVAVSGQAGASGPVGSRRHLAVADVRVDVALVHPRGSGEYRFLLEPLVETFLLLITMDLWIKAGAVQTTLSQMARLNLFLKHDMKNVAQSIRLLADQLDHTSPEAESRLLARLRSILPLIAARADRILARLAGSDHSQQPPRSVDLAEALRGQAQAHGLGLDLQPASAHPQPMVNLPPEVLDTVLDNLLRNYADAARQSEAHHSPPTLHARWQLEGDGRLLRLCLHDPDAAPVPGSERVFEPFWTGRADGLGIGLYQARSELLAVGGTMSAETDDAGRLRFHLGFPTAVATAHTS